jgi:hypothetical protein
MRIHGHSDAQVKTADASGCRRRAALRGWWRVAGVAGIVALTGAAHFGQQSNNLPPPVRLGETITLPDANAQMEMRDAAQKESAANFAAANFERKKQMNDDSAKLLKLATELKSEVDKSTKDTLSLGVVHKAEEIEKLAHSVKEKMKLSAAAK